MLPAVVPWVVMVALGVFMPRPQAQGEEAAPGSGTWASGFLLAMLAAAMLVPLSLTWIKRYQHGQYTYAGQRGRLEAGTGAFYRLSFKVICVTLLVAPVMGLIAGGGALFVAVGMEDEAAATRLFILLTIASVLIAYARSRLQNLMWGRTRSEALQFHSALGLYWPFAALANACMRLQAVAVDVQGGLSQWIATSQDRPGGATGDAAGDFFGFDLGL